jgi:hypothetical protein
MSLVECRVLSGSGLCIEPISRPQQSYRVCGVSACDPEVSIMRRPGPLRTVTQWKRKFTSPTLASVTINPLYLTSVNTKIVSFFRFMYSVQATA